MRNIVSIIALFWLTLALAGCGGDNGNCGDLGNKGQGTSTAASCSGTNTVATVTVSGTAVSTTGTSTVTAVVKNSAGNPVANASVTFAATAGTLSSATATTDTTGTATTTLTTTNATAGSSITITGSVGSVTGQVVLTVGGGGSTTGSNLASLTAVTSATSILADGSTSATITVLARDKNNDLISGIPVTFSATSGGIDVTQGTTDGTGAAKATLSTAGDTSIRTITVTATSGSLTATATVQVVATSSAGTTVVKSLVLTTSAPYILSDGSTTATISALARDAANNAVSGVPVTFSASSGAVQVVQGSTDATGTAKATLSTGGDSTVRTITVTGASQALSSTVQVAVQAPAVYTLGNGTGTGFVAGAIGVSTTGTLAAGGAEALQLSIVDQNNVLYSAAAVTVTFNSPCIAASLAQILPAGSSTPSNTVSTSTGSLAATYVAKGCSGSDTVTATASVAGQTLSATTTLTIAASTSGSIQFVSATPTSIGLKGTGLNETSTVIFKVLDTTGGAKAGVTVNFTLNLTTGGVSLAPQQAVSAADGTVQTVVSSGTVHEPLRVTASIASPALSTQSSQLTVTTGLPASQAFTIGVGDATYANGTSHLSCPNVEAWSQNGVVVPITVALADRYNNPVPGGTAVSFYTNGGHVVGSCTTPDLAGTAADGTCTALWTSADPRPKITDTPPVLQDGRAQVFATVIGEESFTDTAASGFYQSPDVFDNLGEPYLDANESGAYVLGDHFLDFNSNGTRDAPSGSFVGITCTGTAPGSTCHTTTLALGKSQLVIMSTSLANITPLAASGAFTGTVTGGLTIAHGSSGLITFEVDDQNGNSMAAGTTISGITNAAVGSASISGNSSVGCDSDSRNNGQRTYTVSFSAIAQFPAGVTSEAGAVGIQVVSPSGSTTSYSIPVTIN